MSNGLKIFLIILILVVFGAVAYFLLSDGEYSLNVSPTSAPLQTTDNQPVSGLSAQATADIDADQIGQQFLTQLLNIRSIKLREDIFSRPSFVSLTDFTIELIQLGNEGRVNPFAPFGVDGNTEPFSSFDESQGEFTGDGSSSFGPGIVVPMAPSPMPQDQTPNPNINNS